MLRTKTTTELPKIEDLERGLVTISRLIQRYGETYLPFMFFLEEALVEARKREAALLRVSEYAERNV